MEPLPEDEPERVVFSREIIGNAIPPSFLPACEKGFREASNCGGLTGHPVQVQLTPSHCCEPLLRSSPLVTGPQCRQLMMVFDHGSWICNS